MIRLEDRITELKMTPGVVGVDEAGRGPLAGPVVVAAVVLPDSFDARGIDDSKKMRPEARRKQAERILKEAVVSIVCVEPDEIDRLNILEATMEGMRRAIAGITLHVSEALIDGNRVPTGLACQAFPVVKGDGIYASIAAASIVAKQTRDDLMVEYATRYPKYGFHAHFGYPTPEHLAALKMYGPCPIHRRSYGPVRDALLQPCLIPDR